MMWSLILHELKRRNVPNYLVNLIRDYYSNEKIKIANKEAVNMTTSFPQGSVIGHYETYFVMEF